MIRKIAHLADIHIRKSTDRHDEYRKVFDKLYDDLIKESPDRIVIVGDLYDNYIDIEGEALLLTGEFLTKLSNISPVIVTVGNHEIRKDHLTRINTVETVISLMKHSGITYYNKTGFYEDENVIWSVWDHVDKGNPWLSDAKKDKSKIYIDLYHNPINGSTLFNGMKIKGKYPNVSDFKGDYSFLGDIHKRQFFKNKTKAYPSSLLQQDHGEPIYNHGYLLWDIINKNVKEKNIENEHKFITVKINKETNYDELKLSESDKNDKIKIKVKWEDYNSNINTENEIKIRNKIKDIIGTESIEIEKNRLYVDISESKLVSESIDINSVDVQKEIIEEYLKINKVEDRIIKKILNLDDTISNRLTTKNKKNIDWTIDKIWFNNFKSYGDDNYIEWGNIDGIVQIHGKNQQGKTTLLDVICYILYGTTLSTQKREKMGDNRFINNKRNKNRCDGGAIIDSNGDKYLIYRQTIRKKKKDGDITSCSTKLDYYKGTEIKDENKLVGERRIETQKILDDILGDFKDFIRLSLTNADNLNDLLSMDRSVFMDNIIKDAGYDIFDTKLNEFKNYKKTISEERIRLDVIETEEEINKKEERIIIIENDISLMKKEIFENENLIEADQKRKDFIISKINKIDENLIIDEDNLTKEINISENKISIIKKKVDTIINDISEIDINDYDDELLENLKNELSIYTDNVSKAEIKSLNIRNEIKETEVEISKLKSKKSKILDDISNDIKIDISNIENDIRILNKDIDSKQSKMKEIKNMVIKLKDTSDNSKTCPTCGQIIKNSDHINKEIEKSKIEFLKLKNEIKDKESEIEILKKEIEDIRLLDIENSEIYISKSKEIEVNINDLINDNKNKESIIEKINDKMISISNKIKDMKNDLLLMEEKKSKYIKKNKLESELKDLKIDILNKEKYLHENKELLNKYLDNKKFIEENNKLNEEINTIRNNIENIKSKNKKINDEINVLNSELIITNKIIDDKKSLLEKFKIQEENDIVYNTYLNIMHRDGIPTYLMKKSTHIINNELSDLLSKTDFELFFDDDLNLKMKSKIDDNYYNAVEGSGMERTFHACALKIALRKVNHTSKPDFIMFDEIMSKLVGDSVDKFVDFLYGLKSHIGKIMIIEHNHQFDYDYLISINKDKSGVSSLKVHQ